MLFETRASATGGDNIRVICRFRPVNKVEKNSGAEGSKIVASVHDNCKGVTVGLSGKKQKTFYFDYVFPSNSTQQTIFEQGALPLVDSVFRGYNCTLFAYGQTGSGKTFTMEGEIGDLELEGLIPRMVRALFDQIASDDGDGHEFSIKVSYVEIYNEQVNDLLDPRKRNLHIQGDSSDGFGVSIKNVTEAYVSEPRDVFAQLHNGYVNRSVASTNMNQYSSRSHSVFTLKLEMKKPDGSLRKSKLMMVDLAGSEKVGKTGATGQTLKEAQNINKSLSHLGLVINSLVEGKHPSFRTSKLTRLLSDALGGNSKTSLIVTASPAKYNEDETVSTLRFGYRAKAIKNKAVVNEELSIAEYKKLLQRSEKKNGILKQQIASLQSEIDLLTKEAKKKGIDVAKLLSGTRRQQNMSMTSATMMVPNANESSETQKQVELLQSQVEKANAQVMEFQEKFDKAKEELEDKIQDEMLLRQTITELEGQVNEAKKLRNAHAQLKVTQAALEGLQTQKQQWEAYKQEAKMQYESEIETLQIELSQYKKMAIEYKAQAEEFEKELQESIENPSHLRKAGIQLMKIKSTHDVGNFDSLQMDLSDTMLLEKNADSVDNGGGIAVDEKDDSQSQKSGNYDDEGAASASDKPADPEGDKNKKTDNGSNHAHTPSKSLTEQQLKEFKVLFNFSRKLQERCKKYESEQKKLKNKLKVYKKRDDVNKQLRENWNKQLEQMEAAVLLANEIYHRERLAHESQIAEKNVEIVKLRKFLISLTNGRMTNNANGSTTNILAGAAVGAVAGGTVANGTAGGPLINKANVRQSRIKVPVTVRKTVNVAAIRAQTEESKIDE